MAKRRGRSNLSGRFLPHAWQKPPKWAWLLKQRRLTSSLIFSCLKAFSPLNKPSSGTQRIFSSSSADGGILLSASDLTPSSADSPFPFGHPAMAALAALDAAKAVENIRAYKNTISSVYSFYRHSATRTTQLRQLTAALSGEDMVSLKQPCTVRWLSLHRAVEAMKHNWAAVAMELNEEAVGGNTQAQGLLGQIQTYSFIALTHALADLLPVMTKLNLVFQKDNVNLSSIRPIVQASVAAFTQLRDVPGPEEVTFQAGYKANAPFKLSKEPGNAMFNI
ncbi:hypothetical protein PO909_001281 [Leuciscus waleckii]